MNTEFFILCFSSLFTLINPIGIIPMFIAMTDECSKKERDIIAFKSVLFAFFILILFGLLGEFIFSFYDITIHGFDGWDMAYKYYHYFDENKRRTTENAWRENRTDHKLNADEPKVKRLSLFDTVENEITSENIPETLKEEPVISNNADLSENGADEVEIEESSEFDPNESDHKDSDIDQEINQETEEELLDIPTFLRRQAN